MGHDNYNADPELQRDHGRTNVGVNALHNSAAGTHSLATHTGAADTNSIMGPGDNLAPRGGTGTTLGHQHGHTGTGITGTGATGIGNHPLGHEGHATGHTGHTGHVTDHAAHTGHAATQHKPTVMDKVIGKLGQMISLDLNEPVCFRGHREDRW